MAVAKAQGKLRGRQPKFSPKQQRELNRMHKTGEYTITDLGELFSVSRPTVCRTINRVGARNYVVAGQAAVRYSLMRPSHRLDLMTHGGS
jgi:DNA invertase Pin-like site-specific DNA recombinase